MNDLQRRVLEIAARQVGVREAGRNRGIVVEAYQRAAGAQPGDPWCAAFVVWCFREAVHQLNVPMPLPITPGALKLWRRSDPWLHWHQPTPGAVFVHDHGGGLGHCGLVEEVRADGTLVTLEGNTGPSPGVARTDRDGDGVYRRHDRTALDVRLVGFIDVSRERPE
jgi:hypothetical protein